MIGELPQALTVAGKSYAIRADFRNILRIFEAFADDGLRDRDKFYVCMRRLYVDFDAIPGDDYREAYEQAVWFIECGQHHESKGPRLVNWTHDEQMIFPAINKVAGTEVRAMNFLHWWTFMGWFQCIDREDLWGSVLSIRQKRSKGKKLEKWEQEFYNANTELCRVDGKPPKTAEESLSDLFNALIGEGGGQ